jgi:hypothetical protein
MSWPVPKKRVVFKCFSLLDLFFVSGFTTDERSKVPAYSGGFEYSDYSHHSTPTEEYYRDQREGFLNSLLVDEGLATLSDTGTVTNTPAHVSFCV